MLFGIWGGVKGASVVGGWDMMSDEMGWVEVVGELTTYCAVVN